MVWQSVSTQLCRNSVPSRLQGWQSKPALAVLQETHGSALSQTVTQKEAEEDIWEITDRALPIRYIISLQNNGKINIYTGERGNAGFYSFREYSTHPHLKLGACVLWDEHLREVLERQKVRVPGRFRENESQN